MDELQYPQRHQEGEGQVGLGEVVARHPQRRHHHIVRHVLFDPRKRAKPGFGHPLVVGALRRDPLDETVLGHVGRDDPVEVLVHDGKVGGCATCRLRGRLGTVGGIGRRIVAFRNRGLVGVAKAAQVRCHHREPVCQQRENSVPVKTGRGSPVQQQQRRALACGDVVHPDAVHARPPGNLTALPSVTPPVRSVA